MSQFSVARVMLTHRHHSRTLQQHPPVVQVDSIVHFLLRHLHCFLGVCRTWCSHFGVTSDAPSWRRGSHSGRCERRRSLVCHVEEFPSFTVNCSNVWVLKLQLSNAVKQTYRNARTKGSRTHCTWRISICIASCLST